MTRDQAKELLPIIQAFADGKEVQVNSCGVWQRLCREPTFSLSPDHYRIKPEPREYWLIPSERIVKGPVARGEAVPAILVREVIEE